MNNLNDLKKIQKPQTLAVFFGYKTYNSFARIVFGTPDVYKYHTFKLPKASGGERLIESPNKKISAIQHQLLSVLEEAYKPHPCAYGYISKRSAFKNACQHMGKKLVLNIDLKDFFPSIHFGRIKGIFQHKPFELPPNIASILANICCYKGHLPQGAPTSPILSNLVSAKMDKQFFNFARSKRCTYTRYADDITFSFTCKKRYIPKEMLIFETGNIKVGPVLEDIITSNGFKVNEDKVRLCDPSKRIEVTGITLNVMPNVKRQFIRQISSILNAWEKYGYDLAEATHLEKYWHKVRATQKLPKLHRIIHGKLTYLQMVRGLSDDIYVKLAKKYNNLCTDNMLKIKYRETLSNRIYVSRATVVIECCDDTDDWSSQGTGFFLKNIGLVTCYHVVDHKQPIIIKVFQPNEIFVRASITCYSKEKDIAILRIHQSSLYGNHTLEASTLCCQPDDDVYISGYPQYVNGDGMSHHKAKITALTKIWGVDGFTVGMNICKGNSGGPVTTYDNRVVGIVADGAYEADGTWLGRNRLIPASEINNLMKENILAK